MEYMVCLDPLGQGWIALLGHCPELAVDFRARPAQMEHDDVMAGLSDCLRVLAHEDAAVVEIRRRIPAREEQDVQERSCSAPAGLTRPVRRLMNRRPLRAKSRTLLRRRCGIASRNRCFLSNSTASAGLV